MAPIFILPGSGRSGTTWLARLITSSKEALVWSETGLFSTRFNYLNAYRWTYAVDSGRNDDLHYFRKHGSNMWAAMLRPFEGDFNRHWAKMMDGVFQEGAEKEGYKRWGLKEVTWNLEDVFFIRDQWQDYRIIFLTRNFLDCYRSSIGTGWLLGDTGRTWFIREWVKMTGQILSLSLNDKEKIFKYEDIVQDQDKLTDWCCLPRTSKIDYVGASAAYITKHDWEMINKFASVINPLLQKLDYGVIGEYLLYPEELANLH